MPTAPILMNCLPRLKKMLSVIGMGKDNLQGEAVDKAKRTITESRNNIKAAQVGPQGTALMVISKIFHLS